MTGPKLRPWICLGDEHEGRFTLGQKVVPVLPMHTQKAQKYGRAIETTCDNRGSGARHPKGRRRSVLRTDLRTSRFQTDAACVLMSLAVVHGPQGPLGRRPHWLQLPLTVLRSVRTGWTPLVVLTTTAIGLVVWCGLALGAT